MKSKLKEVFAELTGNDGKQIEPEELTLSGAILWDDSSDEEILEELESIQAKLEEAKSEGAQNQEKVEQKLQKLQELVEDTLASVKKKRLYRKIEDVISQVTELKSETHKLAELIEERDQLVRTLSEENNQLRKEFIFEQVLGQGVDQLVRVRKNILGKLSTESNGKDEETAFLETLDSQLVKALEAFGVELIQEEPGTEFRPNYQKAIETRTVDTNELDGEVLESFRPGYKLDDKLIEPQKVVVGKFEGGAADE